MKTLFALLTLCITSLTFAHSTQYHDEDIGLLMTIPDGFAETWYVRNYKCDFDIKVFNTDEGDEEISVVAIAKMPLSSCLEEDVSEFIPALFEQIEEALDASLFDDIGIKLVSMPSLVEMPNAQAFHAEIFSDDLEDQVMQFDFHLFFENGYFTTIVTGGVFNERFTNLTKQVLTNVRFIQE